MDKRPDQRRPERRPEGRGLGKIEDKVARPKGDGKTWCAECGGKLKARGVVGRGGHLRWKCRKCGRTVWIRPDVKPPVPVVPVSRLADLLAGVRTLRSREVVGQKHADVPQA